MIPLDFLERIEIFQGLNRDQLEKLSTCGVEVDCNQDDVLFEEGQDAASIWVVMEGRVDLRFDLPGIATSEENTISSVSAAGAIGWSSFVPPYKYRLSGYCASAKAKLLKMEKDCLIELFENDPQTGYLVMSNMAAVAGRRFHRLQDEVAERRGQHIISGW